MNTPRDFARKEINDLLSQDIRTVAGNPLTTINDDLAQRLWNHGSGTIRALLWNYPTFAFQKPWYNEDERQKILAGILLIDVFITLFESPLMVLFWDAVKLPGEFLPAINNPAGEPFFGNTNAKQNAQPWTASWKYEQRFAEQLRKGRVDGV